MSPQQLLLILHVGSKFTTKDKDRAPCSQQ